MLYFPTSSNWSFCTTWQKTNTRKLHLYTQMHGSRPRPRPRCTRRGPSSPQKGHSSPPSFRLITSGKRLVRKSSCPGIVLSGKGLVREMSCPGNVLSAKRLSGKVIVRETSVTRCLGVQCRVVARHAVESYFENPTFTRFVHC